MRDESFLAAARAYWDAAGRAEPLPSLPDAPLEALLALIDAAGSPEGAGFASLPVASSYYEAMAVGDEGAPHRLFWALEVAEMAPFVNDALPDALFVVDRHPDPKGEHRVYGLVDLERGPLEFPGLVPALRWMEARVRHARGLLAAPALLAVEKETVKKQRDKWEKTPEGGRVVLEGLLETPLPEAWDAYARGKWPVVEAEHPAPPAKGSREGQGRWLALWAVTDFLKQRRFSLPEGLATPSLAAPQLALLEHLRAFDEGIRGRRVPSLVTRAAGGEDPALAERARAWIARHDASFSGGGEGRGATEPPPAAAPPLTPFAQRLMSVLGHVLETLVAEGQLELDPGARPALLAELTEAGSDARSVKHMIRKITNALVHSEHVDEIYVSDDALETLLRRHLGEP